MCNLRDTLWQLAVIILSLLTADKGQDHRQ